MHKPHLILKASDPGHFRLEGEITHQTVLDVLDVEMISSASDISVDFSGVTRSDSAGLALMTHWARLARASHVGICYEAVPDKLIALAKMSGLESVLSISATKK